MEITSEQVTPEEAVLGLVMARRRSANKPPCPGMHCPACRAQHLTRIQNQLETGAPLEFVLPAFPAKSPNLRKVLGVLPDYAEELALRSLVNLCQQIKAHYPPGARIIICSDGRCFSDMVLIPDHTVTRYQGELRRMVERVGDGCLDLFNLDDIYGDLSHDEMRQVLEAKYADPLESIRTDVRAGGQMLSLYRGITRFLYEDGKGVLDVASNAALQRDCRRRAYGVIHRSQAWGKLIAHRFPWAVRLSIHPQPCGAPKLGIHFIQTTDDWLSPWHSVALEHAGRFQLMKREEAERRGAHMVFRGSRLSHFHLPAPADA